MMIVPIVPVQFEIYGFEVRREGWRVRQGYSWSGVETTQTVCVTSAPTPLADISKLLIT